MSRGIPAYRRQPRIIDLTLEQRIKCGRAISCQPIRSANHNLMRVVRVGNIQLYQCPRLVRPPRSCSEPKYAGLVYCVKAATQSQANGICPGSYQAGDVMGRIKNPPVIGGESWIKHGIPHAFAI